MSGRAAGLGLLPLAALAAQAQRDGPVTVPALGAPAFPTSARVPMDRARTVRRRRPLRRG